MLSLMFAAEVNSGTQTDAIHPIDRCHTRHRSDAPGGNRSWQACDDPYVLLPKDFFISVQQNVSRNLDAEEWRVMMDLVRLIK
jgi:hypothetical protein